MRQRSSDVIAIGGVAFLAALFRPLARVVAVFAREVRVFDAAFLTLLVSFVLVMPLSCLINADNLPHTHAENFSRLRHSSFHAHPTVLGL
jgi:hypothetical protein